MTDIRDNIDIVRICKGLCDLHHDKLAKIALAGINLFSQIHDNLEKFDGTILEDMHDILKPIEEELVAENKKE